MTVRLAKEKKEIFDKLCEAFGMSANTAVNLFVNAVVRKQAIPFAMAIDDRNDARNHAIAAFRRIREQTESGGRPEMTADEIDKEIKAVRENRQGREKGASR